MSVFYENMAQTAERLVSGKGVPVIVRRYEKTFDPLTSTTVTTNTIDQELSAVLLAGKVGGYDQTLTPDEIVGQTKSAILSTVGSSFVPEPLDDLLVGDDLWTVYGVSSIDPESGTPVIYKLGIMYKNKTS